MRNAPRLGGGCVIKRPTLVVIESPQKSTKVSNISQTKENTANSVTPIYAKKDQKHRVY